MVPDVLGSRADVVQSGDMAEWSTETSLACHRPSLKCFLWKIEMKWSTVLMTRLPCCSLSTGSDRSMEVAVSNQARWHI